MDSKFVIAVAQAWNPARKSEAARAPHVPGPMPVLQRVNRVKSAPFDN